MSLVVIEPLLLDLIQPEHLNQPKPKLLRLLPQPISHFPQTPRKLFLFFITLTKLIILLPQLPNLQLELHNLAVIVRELVLVKIVNFLEKVVFGLFRSDCYSFEDVVIRVLLSTG